MRIIVAGSRLWRNKSIVNNAVHEAWLEAGKPYSVTIVCDDTPGPSMITREYAPKLGFKIEMHEVDWSEGSESRLTQYKEIVSSGADLCLMFIRHESRGATKFAELATEAGIPVKTWRE